LADSMSRFDELKTSSRALASFHQYRTDVVSLACATHGIFAGSDETAYQPREETPSLPLRSPLTALALLPLVVLGRRLPSGEQAAA